jgi:iron-only hydrogenase group A
MEEGTELVGRIKNGGKLPMMTSCSPGWIKFVEDEYPDFIDNLSTCKSPQQMLGAVVKSFFAERENIDPEKIFNVSIMPCTAKKFEAARPEMGNGGVADIDAVITTRELVRMIKMRGLDLRTLEPDTADTPFGERTSAGKIFGASGGVMEAALRSAHFLVEGCEMDGFDVKDVRGLDGVKEAVVNLGGMELKMVVANGLGNARKVLDEIRAGQREVHFMEVMTCPGGCINGGGQPVETTPEAVRARMKSLYRIDASNEKRTSHSNEAVQRLYSEYMGEPNGELSHKLLHTGYSRRR